MCGIVGYIGDRDLESVLIVGLERLSYRGYDSSGIATIHNGELSCWKKQGKIHELSNTLKNYTIKGQLGIGHTRWATHGVPNEVNAHPHVSNRRVAIVHNGIIENFEILKKELKEKGYIFRSETDSEVISHLIDSYLDLGLLEAVYKAVARLDGAYGLAVVAETEPDKIVVCRKGSPLIIGIGQNENYISSDINALLTHTKEMIYLEDGELAVVTKTDVNVYSNSGDPVEKVVNTITWDASMAEKSGYDHFMLKEIYEQPTIIRNILAKYLTPNGDIHFKDLSLNPNELIEISRFIIQACGTSWHAGLVAKYLFEQFGRTLTEVDISSEFRYRQLISAGKELVVALSQSGETADTLACLREAKSKFFKVLSFVNVKNSSMHRESDGVIFTHAGQEVGVASTKNFIAQLTCIVLFSLYLGRLKHLLKDEDIMSYVTELKKLPEYIDRILSQNSKIEAIAEKYYKSREFIFVGRGVNFPSALEGALKLKEISYIHAAGYAAGELKHGPIALIDESCPVVCIAPKASTYEKMMSNIQEIRARGGRTIIIATEGDHDIQAYAEDILYIPEISEVLSPILVAVPMQLLAYHIAVKLDCDVDQPRNLAKSVTVE